MPKSEVADSKNLQNIITEVLRKSAVDLEFRALALRDAAAAIAKVSPSPLPADASFRFVDNSGSLKTVVLPDPISAEDLSDMELEEVAGGLDTITGGVQWARG
jgi:hypothetical protein